MKAFWIRGLLAVLACACTWSTAMADPTLESYTLPDKPGRSYIEATAYQISANGNLLFQPAGAGSIFDRKTDIRLAPVSPDRLAALFPQANAGIGSEIDTSSNILGVHLNAFASQAPGIGATPEYAVSLPCRSGPTRIVNDGNANQNQYGVVFFAASAQQAYQHYVQFVDGNSQLSQNGTQGDYLGSERFTGRQFRSALYSCSVQQAGINPIAGNPDSLQYNIVEGGLDFAAPTIGPDDGPWGVGLRIGRVDRNGTTGVQIDGRISHSWRLGEGSRSLLTFDAPVTYFAGHGAREIRGYGALSLQYQMQPNWVLEPRIAYGIADAIDDHVSGELFSASVTSLLKFDGMTGRGAITLGNMIGYTGVTHVRFEGHAVKGGHTQDAVFRNGISYDLPLKSRIGGRNSSLRASYAFTFFAGDQMFTNKLHEATVSLGVRSRGADFRNSFELFRIGLIGKVGAHYNAVHLFVGYRF